MRVYVVRGVSVPIPKHRAFWFFLVFLVFLVWSNHASTNDTLDGIPSRVVFTLAWLSETRKTRKPEKHRVLGSGTLMSSTTGVLWDHRVYMVVPDQKNQKNQKQKITVVWNNR